VERGLTGIDVEQRLRTRLEQWCSIEADEVLDHQYKFDFVVNRFKKIPKLGVSMGVQVTVNIDARPKRQAFLNIHRDAEFAPKAVYLEVECHPYASNLEGIANVAALALGNLAFGREYRGTKVIGLRINRDLTFDFFDLEQSGNVEMSPETIIAKTSDLAGSITAFSRESGDGFVASEGYPDGLYFQVKDVDSPASQELLRERNGEWKGRYHYFSQPFPVLFDVGGIDPGQTRPRALNIRLPFAERLIA
jgi:hypothetical protein